MFVFLGVEVFFIPGMCQMLSLGNHGCFFSEKNKHWLKSGTQPFEQKTHKIALG